MNRILILFASTMFEKHLCWPNSIQNIKNYFHSSIPHKLHWTLWRTSLHYSTPNHFLVPQQCMPHHADTSKVQATASPVIKRNNNQCIINNNRKYPMFSTQQSPITFFEECIVERQPEKRANISCGHHWFPPDCKNSILMTITTQICVVLLIN